MLVVGPAAEAVPVVLDGECHGGSIHRAAACIAATGNLLYKYSICEYISHPGRARDGNRMNDHEPTTAGRAPGRTGLYDPSFEHDACGVGFLVNVDGSRTHRIVADGITVLKNLVHRGAVGGDQRTGDGAGLLCQIPHRFFEAEAARLGVKLPAAGAYGVGMFFLPRGGSGRERAKQLVDRVMDAEGVRVLGWRAVPAEPDCLGEMALASMPGVEQALVAVEGLAGEDLERKLYVARKALEAAAPRRASSWRSCTRARSRRAPSSTRACSSRRSSSASTPTCRIRDFESALAVVHQRYSTNTFPSWPLAHPFRCIAHNGEINTLRGNINKMNAREKTMSSPAVRRRHGEARPGHQRAAERLGHLRQRARAARPRRADDRARADDDGARGLRAALPHERGQARLLRVPRGDHGALGRARGHRLQRRHRRSAPSSTGTACARPAGWSPAAASWCSPPRWACSTSRPRTCCRRAASRPGSMFLVDTAQQRVMNDNEIKAAVSRRQPYRRWLEANRIELKGLYQVPAPLALDHARLRERQWVFGYTLEDLTMIIAPMVENSQEPIGSMGNDQALAVLSERPQLLFNYFKQLFAQVTNPPIDPYREKLVMSLMSFTGREGNLLDETPEHCPAGQAAAPDPDQRRHGAPARAGPRGLPLVRAPDPVPRGRRVRGPRAGARGAGPGAEARVDEGYSLLVLSDRDVDARRAPIPALLATAAVHHHLVRVQKRHLTGLVVETAEAREVMHFATLIGYGASAVNPYLAIETIADLRATGKVDPSLTLEAADRALHHRHQEGAAQGHVQDGHLDHPQLQERPDLRGRGPGGRLRPALFPRHPLAHRRDRRRRDRARDPGAAPRRPTGATQAGREALDSGGAIHYRRFSEGHRLGPEAIAALQQAVRAGRRGCYRQYAALMNDESEEPLHAARPLRLRHARSRAARRGGAGRVDREALRHLGHVLRLHQQGGPRDPRHRHEPARGREQLGRGRRGRGALDARCRTATRRRARSSRWPRRGSASPAHYLVNARELQIKMAQGAKPGEGGQLPGHKVDEIIAKVRHSTPGVTLISPPPHHDIYSIEDLAQLIYDLKNANPEARVSVKLVAEVGVGTVAAGVAKGKADMVLISGHDGGTGNSPISSIKHAGIPWEIGLAETQQTLVLNRLRDRIRVQVDGQMRTGRDVVIAALLGAEEFGFGTMALVTLGCIMMRKCHLNTCPVGVATQDPRLRARFTGKPEHVMNFMRFVAAGGARAHGVARVPHHRRDGRPRRGAGGAGRARALEDAGPGLLAPARARAVPEGTAAALHGAAAVDTGAPARPRADPARAPAPSRPRSP